MADRMAAEIHIGGKIPRSLVPELCRQIVSAGVGLEHGCQNFRPQGADDLRDACANEDEGQVLILYDDEARCGEFESLERFLREHQIAYTRRSEGRYEYSPQTVEFRPPDQLVEYPCSADFEPMVAATQLSPIQQILTQATAHLHAGDFAAAQRTVEEALRQLDTCLPPTVSPLEPLEIIDRLKREQPGD